MSNYPMPSNWGPMDVALAITHKSKTVVQMLNRIDVATDSEVKRLLRTEVTKELGGIVAYTEHIKTAMSAET